MINLSTNEWEIENIETVLFDKDGTFIDLHYFWGRMTEMRVAEIIKRYGLSDEDFNKLCMSLGYDVVSRKMLPDGITALYSRTKIIELFKNDLKSFGVIVTTQDLEYIFDYISTEFYKSMQSYTRPIDEAIEFIKSLHTKGVKLGVVTSDSKESTVITLKHFGWEIFFDIVIGRESSPYTKESGEPTKLALQQLNADPRTTIMIGDAPMDYISAKNAGIEKIILVATGQLGVKDLRKISDYVVPSLNVIDSRNINIS